MSERRSSAEQEAFWAGHSFYDDCPATIEAADIRKSCALGCLLLPYSFPRAIIETTREYRMESNARKQLQEFLSLMPDSPIKKLSNGEAFNPADFPVGTKLKISETAETDRVFLEHKLWGLIMQDHEKKDVVVAFNEETFTTSGYMALARCFSEEIEVDKVRHFITGNLQSLRKFNWLEVWQYGRGIRDRVPEKKTSQKGILRRA